jgi:hypothetical protein
VDQRFGKFFNYIPEIEALHSTVARIYIYCDEIVAQQPNVVVRPLTPPLVDLVKVARRQGRPILDPGALGVLTIGKTRKPLSAAKCRAHSTLVLGSGAAPLVGFNFADGCGSSFFRRACCGVIPVLAADTAATTRL